MSSISFSGVVLSLIDRGDTALQNAFNVANDGNLHTENGVPIIMHFRRSILDRVEGKRKIGDKLGIGKEAMRR